MEVALGSVGAKRRLFLGGQLLPALLKVMEDTGTPRVQVSVVFIISTVSCLLFSA